MFDYVVSLEQISKFLKFQIFKLLILVGTKHDRGTIVGQSWEEAISDDFCVSNRHFLARVLLRRINVNDIRFQHAYDTRSAD